MVENRRLGLIENHIPTKGTQLIPISILFVCKIQYKALLRESVHDKTNKMSCAPSEESDQPGHPQSLIIVFAVCSIGNNTS